LFPLAKDWLGRQFALDFAGAGVAAPRLLLIEPGPAEAFDVECGIVQLFDVDMVDDPATFLAADLFAEWRRAGGETPRSSQCVGFKVPLFLGGEGDVSNLEMSDEEVYWSLLGQLSQCPVSSRLQPVDLVAQTLVEVLDRGGEGRCVGIFSLPTKRPAPPTC
jgi:hypothetical protein